MGYFSNLFSSFKSRVKNQSLMTQKRVVLVVSVAGFAQRSVEDSLLPILESDSGIQIPQDLKKKIVAELALAFISSARISASPNLDNFWGMEPEMLREILVIMILSENGDERQVLENLKYSSNHDEARVQVLLFVENLIDVDSGSLIERLNSSTFGFVWNGLVTDFIDGSLTAMNRNPLNYVLEAAFDRLEALAPRSKSIVEGFIQTSQSMKQKPSVGDFSHLLDPNCRTQILFNKSKIKAVRLRDHLNKLQLRPEVPGFESLLELADSSLLQYCMAYTFCLVFLAEIKKNYKFAQTDEFTVLYDQTVLFIAEMGEEATAKLRGADKVDKKFIAERAKKDMAEAEKALLAYVEATNNKEASPDLKLLDYIISKLMVPESLRKGVEDQLRLFNTLTIAEFGKV